MDGDGDMDILSASYGDDTIAWYENNGAANPTWAAANIVTNANGAHSVFAADMDGDGDMDIISTSSQDNTVAWYENDPDIDDILTDGNGNLLSLTTSLTYQSTTKTITANLGVGAVDFTSIGNGKWEYMHPSSAANYNYGQYSKWGFFRSRQDSQTQQGLLEFNDGRTTQAGFTRLNGVFEGHTYFSSNAQVTWEVAKSTAESLGGYLLVVNSTHEWGWIQDQEPDWDGFINSKHWIGLSQDPNTYDFAEPQGGWRWVNGVPLQGPLTTYTVTDTIDGDNEIGRDNIDRYIAKYVIRQKIQIAIRRRGYKRKTKGMIVATNKDTYLTIGDEPSQYNKKFSSKAIIIVSEDRNLALKYCDENRPDVVASVG